MKFRAMTNSGPRNHRTSYTNPLNAALTACALVIALAIVAPEPAFAQTFSVIYKFAGGPLGANPYASLVMDRDGNLYGTTFNGGTGTCALDGYPPGCGTVFRFNPSTGRYTVLYQFTGGSDGGNPQAPLLIAPDGTLYGSTLGGGKAGCVGEVSYPGCGVVFHLRPRTTPPRNVLENYWVETPIYTFSGSDGNGTRLETSLRINPVTSTDQPRAGEVRTKASSSSSPRPMGPGANRFSTTSPGGAGGAMGLGLMG
jgi:uncharacterized repeat protein (TIGR03803 family)